MAGFFKKIFADQEPLSIGAFGGSWQVQTRKTISSAAQVNHALNVATTIVSIQPDSDVYVKFSTTQADTNSANNDFKYAGNGLTIHPLSVPKGLQEGNPNTIVYMHIKQVTSVASKFCRVVEH